MFTQLKESGQTRWLAEAFSTLPMPIMTPSVAYQQLVRGHIEHVPLDELEDRVLATSVVPYPPGIPMLMESWQTGNYLFWAMPARTLAELFVNRTSEPPT